MSVLLVLPPLTQVNTPYPSVCHLAGFLRSRGVDVHQADIGIEVIDGLFCRDGLRRVFDVAEGAGRLGRGVRRIVSARGFYEGRVDGVVRFLRGECEELASLFCRRSYWEGMCRLPEEDELEWAYGVAGAVDRAKYLCSLFLKDVADVVRAAVDDRFELIRYGESVCTYLSDFGLLEGELERGDTLVTELMLGALERHLERVSPEVVGLSVPFPGNLIGALVCARYVRERCPGVRIVLGGGYVNTELRRMRDVGIFRYVDYVTFDDGELPLWRIVSGGELLRTARLVDGRVVYENMVRDEGLRFGDLPAPSVAGLPLELYMDFVDTTNPMHRLWSDGRWNKMMLAHGCYWAKCAFCDTSLDYIGRFEGTSAEVIVDRMEVMMRESGRCGFHFVDEAAPPAVLRGVAEEILRRGLVVSYWTNVRFDRSFTPELCGLLARSGCIAVSGGLEVASPRVLKLINKGVTVESASECMRNLSEAGVMVHAYLMYGFPSQTVKELYQSLTTVRDLFARGWVQSAFWHRYAMTCHSPSGLCPESVGAEHVSGEWNGFANNEIPFRCEPAVDWGRYSEGLSLATYNYMRGAGFDLPAKYWFK